MNKQQSSGHMRCRSIVVSDTNNYQFISSLIQSHILFHPFISIISNRNYKLPIYGPNKKCLNYKLPIKKPTEPAGAVLIRALMLMVNWLGSSSKPA
jgi:hypothetical protein